LCAQLGEQGIGLRASRCRPNRDAEPLLIAFCDGRERHGIEGAHAKYTAYRDAEAESAAFSTVSGRPVGRTLSSAERMAPVVSRNSESRWALSPRTAVSIGVGGTTMAVLSGPRCPPRMSDATGSGSRASSCGQKAPAATATAPSTAMIAIARRRRLGSSFPAASRARAAAGRGAARGGSGAGAAGAAISGMPGGVGKTVSPTGSSAPT
jgi:hypothetical protein